jgi:prevent-host-death family protein
MGMVVGESARASEMTASDYNLSGSNRCGPHAATRTESDMDQRTPETRTMKISDVKRTLSGLVNEVYRNETRVLIEKSGIPVAALVSLADLAHLARLDEQRDKRRQILDAMRAPFRGVPAEEIEREAAKAIAEVRAERRAAREAAAKSA